MYTMPARIVISQSALASFAYCRKQYYYGYEMLREPNLTTAAIEDGSDFHRILEYYDRNRDLGECPSYDGAPPMLSVANAYLEHRPLKGETIIAETPIYVKLLDRMAGRPEVWLRCTPDRIYREGKWVRWRDYKTFDKWPSMEPELDFQAKFYTAVGRKIWGPDVMFEWEFVRRTPPNVVKDKSGGKWAVDECYHTEPFYPHQDELDILWKEAQQLAKDLVRAKAEDAFYRIPRRGAMPFTCGTCLFRKVCTADMRRGGIDEQTLELLSTKREPLAVPKELENCSTYWIATSTDSTQSATV